MTRVKICGLMRETEVEMAASAGADSLGFVTEYPVPVPWNLSRSRSAELAALAPPFVTTTAVVGGPVAEMVAIARTVRPHFLQLHGDETLEEIEAVCSALADTGIKVLKALRIFVDTGEALFKIKDPVEACAVLEQTGIAGIVVDSKTSSRPAGTGVTLDWSALRGITDRISLPLILAGGLNAGNVGKAIEVLRPYAVDVISGVERRTGEKDPDLIREFVQAAKRF
ncbi:phosphoribosylanthranilate isomerase [Syntrophus gentianae]|uniref:N-(5'-phosphoribosyl)anthranilate isomerase n=1 Tax=Syntrophus gentianae TaxID=43775 RepID=A0A1H7VP14_9BACT|nr:phosphoribosylanthranilate isomerase [Syntrophus gentianae]SEM11013.1 phosphoribosylanthranilate isomerase [Syntrophus gentianae]